METDQQQFKAVFEHATEGIILTDEQGRIVLLNPAAIKMFGYEPEELPGQSIDVLIPHRFHPRHATDRQHFYHHPGNRVMGSGRDLYAMKKDDTEFPVEVSLSYYKEKGALYVIAFIVDITSRKALQELEKSQAELKVALDKEKEINEIKSRFVSMASHEFRTPLSTILSSANLLSRYTKTEDQDKRDRHIKKQTDAVKHLNNLLEDFLSLGRLEEGKVKPESAGFLLRDFLEEVTEEMQSFAKPGQTIHCRCNGDLQLFTDKRLLKNILINLLSNAVKFSPENSSIYLDAEDKGAGQLCIAVRDTGIGISEADQQHLFSSFFRGANALNIAGTGLGLHIVRRYADLLGGSIRIESTLGKGTSVLVQLPLGKPI
ncbi:PAS domain-containing sensor histidine kinase [Dinghuibacter silviterrae]|uniref:histidine kinase n=1 Tax=Dinghuibacter silviterrae TaxID=1539049 RepID=A0A4R8DGB4_9BACT|nr:PAS domain-containing sensor histidine kinase [Dinghuibacter silviterrae]TDW96691.1 PAS domain S-box-containing protein [Dinghuibacter silviterrae]